MTDPEPDPPYRPPHSQAAVDDVIARWRDEHGDNRAAEPEKPTSAEPETRERDIARYHDQRAQGA